MVPWKKIGFCFFFSCFFEMSQIMPWRTNWNLSPFRGWCTLKVTHIAAGLFMYVSTQARILIISLKNLKVMNLNNWIDSRGGDFGNVFATAKKLLIKLSSFAHSLTFEKVESNHGYSIWSTNEIPLPSQLLLRNRTCTVHYKIRRRNTQLSIKTKKTKHNNDVNGKERNAAVFINS